MVLATRGVWVEEKSVPRYDCIIERSRFDELAESDSA
jgi:hypothetical protein